jgi:hypothetical protein
MNVTFCMDSNFQRRAGRRETWMVRRMKVPDRFEYALARSGRGRVWHIRDWRRAGHCIGLCDQPLGFLVRECAPPERGPRCKTCQEKLKGLRETAVIVRSDHLSVTGMTIGQVVELALKNNVPADAEFYVHDDYGDCLPVIKWNVTE